MGTGDIQGLNITIPHMMVMGMDIAPKLAELLRNKIGKGLYITINISISNAVKSIKFETVYFPGHYPKDWPNDVEIKALMPGFMESWSDCLAELHAK